MLNLPFLVGGALGTRARLPRRRALHRCRASSGRTSCFLPGRCCPTCFGSALYHVAYINPGPVPDRLLLTSVFAGRALLCPRGNAWNSKPGPALAGAVAGDWGRKRHYSQGTEKSGCGQRHPVRGVPGLVDRGHRARHLHLSGAPLHAWPLLGLGCGLLRRRQGVRDFRPGGFTGCSAAP